MLFPPFSGLYTYQDVSLKPDDILDDTDVIAIVITRWDSAGVRNAIRDMFQNGTRKTLKLKYKLLFLFNLPEGL